MVFFPFRNKETILEPKPFVEATVNVDVVTVFENKTGAVRMTKTIVAPTKK